MAPKAASCHACVKSGDKLLRCGRCRGVWFCNRQCQVIAFKTQGHKGANCRPADFSVSGSSATRPSAVPSNPSMQADMQKLAPCTQADMQKLADRFNKLMCEAEMAHQTNARVGYLAAVTKLKEAATVADDLGGPDGSSFRAQADQLLSNCLMRLGEMPAAARAACSSVREARASGDRTTLVIALSACGAVAQMVPDEMVRAEKASREQERLSGSPYQIYDILDLSQEGRFALPTTPGKVALIRLSYYTAAVAICDAALAACGGRDSPAAADSARVPLWTAEANARSHLGTCLIDGAAREPHGVGDRSEVLNRGFALLRQAVALRRHYLQSGQLRSSDVREGRRALGGALLQLGMQLMNVGQCEKAAACLREALELSESTGDVRVTQIALSHLVNVSVRGDAVGPAEAEAMRLRLNKLLERLGRSPEVNCTICFEPLTTPAGATLKVAASGSGDAGESSDACVHVLNCAHMFHYGCLSTWRLKTSNRACPLCKGPG